MGPGFTEQIGSHIQIASLARLLESIEGAGETEKGEGRVLRELWGSLGLFMLTLVIDLRPDR